MSQPPLKRTSTSVIMKQRQAFLQSGDFQEAITISGSANIQAKASVITPPTNSIVREPLLWGSYITCICCKGLNSLSIKHNQ